MWPPKQNRVHALWESQRRALEVQQELRMMRNAEVESDVDLDTDAETGIKMLDLLKLLKKSQERSRRGERKLMVK